jgi:hypothetical protein
MDEERFTKLDSCRSGNPEETVAGPSEYTPGNADGSEKKGVAEEQL